MLLDIRKRLTIPIDIQETPRMTVLRAYSPLSNPSTDISSVYVFYDASTKAYNPVVYISKNNQISLVMPKSQVASIKNTTLHKLEVWLLG